MNFSVLSEFVSTYTRIYSQLVEKSASLSFKLNFLSLPCLNTRQLTEIQSCTVIFRAPIRALRVALQLQMTVTIILPAF